MQSDLSLGLRNNAKKYTVTIVKSKIFSCNMCKHIIKVQARNQGIKFAPPCRRNYRPYGIEIFGDLASLLDVFGNISKNEIHPRSTV